jgi:electron transport complex protein RnfG
VKPDFLKRFYPVILITLVVLVSAFLLKFTNSITEPVIEAQQYGEIQAQLEVMFPKMTGFSVKDELFTIEDDGAEIGYGFLAEGQGYGGAISILVGLENDTTLRSIIIISQDETPGLGSRVAEEPFTSQFVGISIEDINFPEAGGKIDAISGSTVSSIAVVEAVRATALEKIAALGK